MIAVVSNAWLLPGEEHAAAYFAIAEQFGDFHRTAPGFRGRRMMRGTDDPLHIVNMRWFDSVADYEAMVATPGYGDWINRLSEHVEARNPQKEYVEVIIDDPDPAVAS